MNKQAYMKMMSTDLGTIGMALYSLNKSAAPMATEDTTPTVRSVDNTYNNQKLPGKSNPLQGMKQKTQGAYNWLKDKIKQAPTTVKSKVKPVAKPAPDTTMQKTQAYNQNITLQIARLLKNAK